MHRIKPVPEEITFEEDHNFFEVLEEFMALVKANIPEQVLQTASEEEFKLRINKLLEQYGYVKPSTLERMVQQDVQKARCEARMEVKLEIAKNLLFENIELMLIREVTGLSIKQIEALKDH